MPAPVAAACIVEGCPCLSAWTAVDSLSDYCRGHASEWLKAEADSAKRAPATKACGCGAVHDYDGWSRLPLVAESWEGLQLRNCDCCRSTLTVKVSCLTAWSAGRQPW